MQINILFNININFYFITFLSLCISWYLLQPNKDTDLILIPVVANEDGRQPSHMLDPLGYSANRLT